jgi:hypothetical protein
MDETLEKFGIVEADLEFFRNNPDKKYNILKDKRNKFFITQYKNNNDYVKNAKIEHKFST